MNKKYFVFAFIFVCLTLTLSWVAREYARRNEDLSSSGTATFDRTKSKLSYLGHIRINSAEGGEINLYRREGLWRFKEAKDYFANHGQLNNLFEMFNSSIIISATTADEKGLKKHGLDDANGVLLQSYSLDNTLLEQIIIGNKTKQNTCYARIPEKTDVYYQISNCLLFSANAGDWLPYPLLALPHHLIKSIKTPDFVASHDEINDKIIESVSIRHIILALGSLDYQGIIYKDEMPDEKEIPIETRPVEVEMANGLLYLLNIHKIADEYWVEIQLKTGKVTRKSVLQFIEKNQQYFDKWLFKLDDYDGRLLFEL